MVANNLSNASQKRRKQSPEELIPKTSFRPIAAPGKLNALKYDDATELIAKPRLIHEDLLRIFIASRVPIFLWGPVGAGKTMNIEALSKETDENGTPYQVITVQPSTTDPTSIHGLMVVKHEVETDKEIMVRSIPEMAENVWRYFENYDGLTIMFLDEMTTCIPAQQNAMLGLLTHGKYGDTNISPYTSFALAANPEGTVQSVIPLSEAVINRGGHIPWFSDAQVWFEKWKTGFGNDLKKPKEKTIKFVEGLINAAPDIAFRADPDNFDSPEDMWSVDNLCPYDQMNFSERSVTENADLYEVIQDALGEAPYDIRKLYVREICLAMLGKRWGSIGEAIEETLESYIGTSLSIKALNKYGINNRTTNAEARNLVGDSLHISKGRRMSVEERISLAERFESEIFKNGEFMVTRYHAFILWASTAPNESSLSDILPVVSRSLFKAFQMKESNSLKDIPKDDIVPSFTSEKIIKETMILLKTYKEQQGSR